jgi:hypothetical protein
MKNRLTRIGAEADPHSLIMAKERAKFMESPTTQAMPAESPSSKTPDIAEDWGASSLVSKEILMMSLIKNYQFFLL